LAEPKKQKIDASDLPDGLKELADLPAEKKEAAILLPSAQPCNQPALPPQQPARQKTEKELKLDGLVAKRQSIIEQLKAKNPLVIALRKKIAEAIPAIRGKGASHTLKLAEEAERIEFSIATEAYTPKKEKELIKRLRDIRQELGKHKEIDEARRKVESCRRELHTLLLEIKKLEQELAEARAQCDMAYAEVLAERKAAYEQRQKQREERRKRAYEDLKQRVREEKRKQYEAEIKPYLKNYGDTVSMDEIVEIERKPKKEKEKAE